MDFEQIEDAIITRIRSEVTYLRTVETYAGQLEAEIKSLPVRFPAVYVAFSGSDFQWVDGPSHQEKAIFQVLVAAKNLRGQEKARKDAQGAYEMIGDVLAALTNQKFGLNMERLRPTRSQLLFVNSGVAVYGIDFQTSFDTQYDWS